MSAPRVTIYTAPLCSFCTAAKALLDRRGIAWQEIRVDGDPALRGEMEARSGRRTVPQVFIDGRPIGGYAELRVLDAGGGLDGLVRGQTASA